MTTPKPRLSHISFSKSAFELTFLVLINAFLNDDYVSGSLDIRPLTLQMAHRYKYEQKQTQHYRGQQRFSRCIP
jgi:hypothetical protein